MDQIVVHFQTGFVVCKQCKFAVLPIHLDSHLSTNNHAIPKSERDEIIENVKGGYDLIEYTREIKPKIAEFLSTTFDGNSLPYLSLYRDGISCHDCSYVCRNYFGMQNHCRSEHGWSNFRSKGKRKRTIDIEPWDFNIFCQRFFASGYGSQYFKVLPISERHLEPIPPIEGSEISVSRRDSNSINWESRDSEVPSKCILFFIFNSYI